jgi:cell wall-associated NlpC family hydrolase
VASTSGGISGIGLAVIAAGAVMVYSGIKNQGLIDSLRYLAAGEAIPEGPQKTTPIGVPTTGAGYVTPGLTGGNTAIVNMAASYKGRTYTFGGGHKTVCPTGGMDCSGYVSCVLNRLGLMRGTLNTDGFARWGLSVPFEQRQPGDLVVWQGGPGGGHIGIVIDGSRMWHNPCTGCGGVQIGTYGRTRTGRITLVRRAKSASQPRTVQV